MGGMARAGKHYWFTVGGMARAGKHYWFTVSLRNRDSIRKTEQYSFL